MKKSVKKARDKARKRIESDFIGKGFKKLDSNLISHNPPKIKWGKEFQGWDKDRQIEYLKKLASTMNHAADLIQTERNKLLKLMDLKEEQLEKAQKSMVVNNEMVQTEIAKMNEQRREINSNGTSLKGDALKKQLEKWR